MTTQIRKSVFETNSSSTHSIYISDKKCVLSRLGVDNNGICRIYSGEFGWEVEDYYGAASKASYCMTYAFQMAQYYTVEGGYGYNMEFVKHLLDMLTEVIMENTKAKSVEYVKSDDQYYAYGYIDHKSFDVCSDAFESKETLKNFIFNKNSYLHTDNDND